MKARVKATGEIVEARRLCQSSQGPIWEAEGREYYEYELDFDMKEPPTPPYDPDYWTRLEHQYAGMAMQGLILTASKHMGTDQEVAQWAKEYAHTLVEKYKKEEK